MNRLLAAAVFVTTAVPAFAVPSFTATSKNEKGSYSLNVTMQSTDVPGEYFCKAEVIDTMTGEVFSAPMFVATPASKVTATSRKDGTKSVLMISIDEEKKTATVELELSCGDEVVFAPFGTLDLAQK